MKSQEMKIRSLVNVQNMKRLMIYYKKVGFRGLKEKVLYNLKDEYNTWYQANRTSEEELEHQKQTVFEYQPKISILVPTYNTPENFLREMIESVQNQTYCNFELCLADASTEDEVGQIILQYQEKDDRIKYQRLDENEGISGNTNQALRMASGEYIGLLDHDDLLAKDALFHVVHALNTKRYDVLYSDEDKTDTNTVRFSDPNFKPDYNPDLLLCGNYITHFFVVKHEIATLTGGFRNEYDGAQDFDFIFRCMEYAKSVHHIPKILYHWRIHMNSTAGNSESKSYAYEAGRRAIEDHLKRQNLKVEVEITDMLKTYHPFFIPQGTPVVSVIVISHNDVKNLDRCMKSLYQNNSYSKIQVIVVNHHSDDEKTLKYYKFIRNKYQNLKIVKTEDTQSDTELYNKAVKYAEGEYLLFLDSSVSLDSEYGVSDMLGHFQREEVGVVGGKIRNTDGSVYSAGYVLGNQSRGEIPYMKIHGSDYGYMLRTRTNADYNAVGGECMMVSKEMFLRIQGFDENLTKTLGAIDFCMKVREQGLLVVFDAFAEWTTQCGKKLEQLSDSPEETNWFINRWKKELSQDDGYYNPNFKIGNTCFKLSDKRDWRK